MDRVKKKELLIGIVMLGAGLIYLLLTMNLPRKGLIDAAFVPYVLAAIMCLLGVVQLSTGWNLKSGAPVATPEGGTTAHPDYLTVLKTLGLIVAYIALLDTVGFPIMTVLYLYAQFIVLTPIEQNVAHLRYGAIAVVASALIFVTFRHGFDLMLPAGFLDFIG